MREQMRTVGGEPYAALRRITDALTDAGCMPRARGNHVDARCPAHDDSRPSLSVDWKPDPGRVLVCCQRGCTTEEVAAALGCTLADLYDEPKQRGTGRLPRPATRRAPAASRPARDPRPEPDHKHVNRSVATYTYVDHQGTVTGEVIRRACRQCGEKTFAWRRPAPDGGWEYKAPAERPLYRLPEVLPAAAAGAVVLVTEGEKDADAGRAAGAVATCNPGGAGKWRPEHTEALRGAHVVIVADRDTTGYRHAAAVRDAVAPVAASVSVVEAADGKDLSDHLTAGHTIADLRPVAAAALPAPDIEGEPTGTAEVIPLPRRAGSPDSEPDRKGGGGGGGGGAGGGAVVSMVIRDRFTVVDGVLAQVKFPQGSKRPQYVQVMDAVPRITRRYRMDDGGSRPDLGYDIEVTRAGESVTVDRVLREEFQSLEWLGRLPWDLQYADTPSGRSNLRNAIVATSGEPETVDMFGLIGWRERPDGSWMYVHAGGAIDASGVVEGIGTDLPQQLRPYALPEPPATGEELRSAVLASVAMLERLPARIAAPLLGSAYRSMLGESHRPLFLVGTTGTGKSSLASLTLQHFAPAVRHDRLPVPAGEDVLTFPTLAKLLYLAGDTVMVVDDLAPDRSADRSQSRANQIIRLVFNGTGRMLSTRKGGLQDVRPPRCMVILTGEDGASAASAENRVHYVPLVSGEVPIATLAELSTSELAEGRARLTAAMARHYAGRLPLASWLADQRSAYTVALAEDAEAGEGADWRRAESAAELATGWRAMLDMATERGAITPEEAADWWARAWAGLSESKRRQSTMTARRTLAERVADMLLSALVSGRVHLVHPSGQGHPEDGKMWGWDMPAPGDNFGVPRARGASVGWTDGRTLWLEPGAVFASVDGQARAESDPLNLSKRALGTALADAQVIRTEEATDGRRNEVRVMVGGKRRRVWEAPATWLYPEGEPTEQPPAGPPATDGPEPTAPLPPASPAPRLPEPAPAAPAPAPVAPVPAPVASEAPARRTAPAAPAKFTAGAVVLDSNGAWLSGTLECRPLPEPLETLADVLAFASTLGLGKAMEHGRPDDGQVWIMPDVATRIGLPKKAPAEGKAASTHAALSAARADGWNVKDLRSWMRAYRVGGRTLRVSVVGWQDEHGCPLLKGTPDAPQIAYRIGEYADRAGILFRMTPGVTGLDMSTAIRRKVSLPDTPPTPPKVATIRTLEEDFAWMRPATPEERALPHIVAVDANAMYLGAAAQVDVGTGAARHIDHPVTFDATLPGYWLISLPRWEEVGMPDLLAPVARSRTRPRAGWYATATIKLLAELGYDPQPQEAYVWEDRTRFLLPWAERLRDARAAVLPQDLDGDPEAGAVLATLKRTYAETIGHLARQSSAGAMYHPEWRHFIIATARVNLYRKMHRAAEAEGRRPLLIGTDMVLYATDATTAEEGVPAALKLGTGLGQFKVKGFAPMADVAELLAKEPNVKNIARAVEAAAGPRELGEE